jgi:putative oxidoreductase
MGRLGRFSEQIYGLVRIIAGLLLACHGAQKILGFFGGPPPEMPTGMVWFVGSIELVGGALIGVGLLTRWAAFLCSGLMAGAYFLVHQGNALFPIENHGELAVLYCWIFLLIAARGAGPFSLDSPHRADE